MARNEPSVLTLTAKADQLIAELQKALNKIKDLEFESEKDLEFKIQTEAAIAEIEDLKSAIASMGNASRSQLRELNKDLKSLSELVGVGVAAIDKFAGQDKFNPLVTATAKLRNELDQLVVSLNNSKKASDFTDVRAELKDLQLRYKELGSEVELNGGQVKSLAPLYNSLGNAIRSALSQASREFKNLQETGTSASESLSNKLGQLETVLIELRAAEDKSNQGLLESKAAYQEIGRQLSAVSPLIAKLGSEMPEVVNRFNSLKSGAQSALRSVDSELKKLDDEAQKHGKATSRAIASMVDSINKESTRIPASIKPASDSLSNLEGSVRGVVSVARFVVFSRIIQEIKQLAEASLDTAVELQALRNSFAAVLADSSSMEEGFKRADEAIVHIRDSADTLGLEFIPLAENFLTLQAAGKEAGFTIGEVSTIFDSVSVAAAAMNLSTEKVNRTLAAFEQIMSKGILSAEEIRRQLGNSLPGAFSITARALDVNNKQLEKMLRSGTVLSREALPKIAAELVKTFGPAAIANVTSARAEFARMQNGLVDLRKAAGDGLLPVLTDLAHQFNTADKNTDELRITTGYYASALRDVIGLVGNLLTLDLNSWTVNLASVGTFLAGELGRGVSAVDGLILKLVGLDKASQDAFANSDKIASGVGEIIEELRIWAGVTQSASQVAVEYNQRATKAVAELQKKQAELIAQAPKLKEIEEATKGLPAHYQNIAKELQGIGDDIDVYIKGQHDLNQELDPKFFNAYALRVADLRDRLKEAGALTPQMIKFLEDIESKIPASALALARLSNEFQKLGISTTASIDDSSKSLLDYVAAVRKGGSVTKEQADVIVKAAKDILESLREIPADQRAQFDGLEKVLNGVLGSYSKFTTEAIKEADKLRQETAKAFEGLGKEIEDIFTRLKEKISGATGDNKSDEDIKALNEELSNLQNQSVQSEDDLRRIDEILAQLNTSQKEFGLSTALAGRGLDQMATSGNFFKTTFNAAGAELSKTFADALLGNDKLIEGLSRLPQSSQDAATSLISRFEEISKSGNTTTTDLEDLFKSLVAVFEDAGVHLSGFNEILAGTGDLATQIQAKIADATASAKDELSKKSQDVRDQIQGSAAGASTTFGSNITVNQPSVTGTGQVFKDTSEGLVDIHKKQGDAAKSTEQLANEYNTLSAQLTSGTLSIEDAQKAWERYNVVQDEINKRSDETVIANRDVATSNSDTAKSLVDLSEETNAAREENDKFTLSAEKLADSVGNTSLTFKQTSEGAVQVTNDLGPANDGLEQLAENYQQVGRASDEQLAKIDNQSEAVQQLTKNQDEFNNAAIATYEATQDLTKAQDDSSKSTEEYSATLEQGAKDGTKNLDALSTSASTLEQTMARILELQKQINTAMKEMGT